LLARAGDPDRAAGSAAPRLLRLPLDGGEPLTQQIGAP
jgi:hypothetical protein